MKQRTRVSGRRKVRGKVRRPKASAARRRRPGGLPGGLPEELAGMYKPVKKPITLRLDADILAWFQREGRGYQTRINMALRQLMRREDRKGR